VPNFGVLLSNREAAFGLLYSTFVPATVRWKLAIAGCAFEQRFAGQRYQFRQRRPQTSQRRLLSIEECSPSPNWLSKPYPNPQSTTVREQANARNVTPPCRIHVAPTARHAPELLGMQRELLRHRQHKKSLSQALIAVVPGERIELPTNGLQNRCSTAELTRHLLGFLTSQVVDCYHLATQYFLKPQTWRTLHAGRRHRISSSQPPSALHLARDNNRLARDH
jgi:hypothetical protein